jgi:anti-sigma regulatory factor (Ser/Thr protein kinase)
VPVATRSVAIVANTSSLPAAIEFLRQGAREASLPEDRIGILDLVIEEIFMNVCWHAYPEASPGVVTLAYSIPEPGELRVEIADQGVEFNPLAAPPPDTTLDLESRPIGGLGVLLVKALTPSIAYRRDGDWNRLTFGLSANS